MSKNIYKYETTTFFSNSPTFIATGVLIFGIGLLPTHYFFFGLITLSLLLVILTTHYGLEINADNKTFKHYLWILGYKQTQIYSYDLIEYAFVQSGKVTRTLQSTATAYTFSSRVYNGYIKFSDKNKIHIIQSPEKNTVIKKLQILATDLNIEIVDFTDADAISIVPGTPV